MTNVEVDLLSTPSRFGRVKTVPLGGPLRTERRVLLRAMWARREERLWWKGARTSLLMVHYLWDFVFVWSLCGVGRSVEGGPSRESRINLIS